MFISFISSFMWISGAQADCRSKDSFKDISKTYCEILSESCNEDFVKKMLDSSKDVDSALKKIISPNTQIILLGEYHTAGAGQAGYPALLKRIAKAGFTPDCIALEKKQDTQPSINEALKEKVVDTNKFIDDHGLFEGATQPQALQYAADEKLPVFAIDKGVGWVTVQRYMKSRELYKLKADPNSMPSNEERNVFMAEQLTNLLKTNSCKKIIFIGGLQHLSILGNEDQNLKNLLKNKNVISLGLQSTSDYRAFGDFIPTALRCDSGTKPFDGEFAVIPDKKTKAILTKGILGSDKPSSLSSWQDFDGVLFLPLLAR